MLIVLLQNAALLITLSFFYGALKIYLSKNKLLFQVSSGLWYGLIAIAAMMMSYQQEPGVFYDGRSVVLTLAGLWGGGITALISALVAGIYRIEMGGSGVFAGTATIIFCTLTGLTARQFFLKRLEKIHTLVLIGIGIVTHIVMLLSQLLLPQHSTQIIGKIWLPMFSIFPLAFAMIAKLFQFIDRYINTEQVIRKAEEMYRTTLLSIGDAVICTDREGTITQMNPEAERITEWSATEAIGMKLENVFQLINENTREKISNPFAKVIQSRKISALANHTLLITKNKKEIPVTDSGAPIMNNDEITGVVLVFRDQTEEREKQRKLEQSEAKYRERDYWLNESQRVGKIGSYRFEIACNKWTSSKALNYIFGIDGQFLRTVESWNSIVHPEYQEEMMDYFLHHVVEQKQAFEKEYKIIRINDEKERWVFGRGELRFNTAGEPIEMIGTIQDITERKIFEQQLIESEERFRKAVLLSPIPIMVHDEDGNVLHLSEGWTHYSGYTIEEVPTLDIWTQKVFGERAAEVREQIRDIFIHNETIYSRENELTAKSGIKRIWNFHSTPLGLSGGKKLVLSIAPDITQRIRMKRELEESEKAYRLLFENHIAVKLLIDPETGQIVKANRAAANYYGWSVEELEKMNISDINPIPVEETRKNMSLAFHNQYNHFEFKHRLANGEIREVEVFSSKTDYKGKKVLHSIIHDVTDKKQLMQDLVAAKEKAEESERLKSAFLANVSHEIRTPLHGIVGFSDILAQHDDLPKEKKREFASIINKSSEGLLKIINDILDISRLETSKTVIDIRPFNVNLMLQNIYAIFQNRLMDENKPDLNFKLEKTDQSLILNADEGRITQIFSNLLDNAFRFTSNGIVAFGVSEIGKNDVSFFVSDTGIGIAKEKQEEIFGRFVQAEAGTWRSYGGTGLGLAIVKKLLELMESEITLESEPGQGTTFRFSLPLINIGVPENRSARGTTENKTLSEKRGSSLKVLIVDDDESSRSLLSQVLSDAYPNLLFAETGLQALKLVDVESPDVILLDIGLPDISGIDVALKIRETNRKIKIIVQTAYAMAEDEKNARDAGCDDFLTKPLNVNLLLEKLQKN